MPCGTAGRRPAFAMLELHIVQVLPRRALRLFDGLDAEHSELERVRVLEGEPGVTQLRYRVRRRRDA